MLCQNCGKDVKEGAKFCPHCGSVVSPKATTEQMEPEENENIIDKSQEAETETTSLNTTNSAKNAGGDSNQAPNNASDSKPANKAEAQNAPTDKAEKAKQSLGGLADKFKSLGKKQRYGIVGGTVALIAAIGIGIAIANPFGGISEAEVKQVVENSDFMSKGSISQTYTNETPYELKDFKIDGEESGEGEKGYGWAQSFYGTDEFKGILCSGKIANESFETDFTGGVYYGKFDNQWKLLSDNASIEEGETKPLKGVDNFGDNQGFECNNFTSNLEENGGEYTSTANADITYNFDLAKDTAKATEDFVFDQEKGWVSKTSEEQYTWGMPTKEFATSDEKTTWNFRDKKFKATTDDGMVTNLINLHVDENGKVSADYSITSNVPSGKKDSYLKFKIKGTATGKMEHEFGQDSYSFKLEDKSNKVTFEGSGSLNEKEGKTGVSLSIKTNTPWENYGFFTSNYSCYSQQFDEVSKA